MSSTQCCPVSFKQLADGEILFGPDCKPYMKAGGDSLIPVRPTASGWMGYGKSFKWKPEWELTFERLSNMEADDMIRENKIRDPLVVFLGLVRLTFLVVMLAVLGCVVWYFFVR